MIEVDSKKYVARGMFSAVKAFRGGAELVVETNNKFLTANVAELEGICNVMFLTH
jgi:hypothetical protein